MSALQSAEAAFLAERIVPGVRKIAVLRANAIGDFLFTLPALEAVRAAYPAAEIVLLGRVWHAQFLASRPSPVDRVEVIPPTRGIGEPDTAVDDPDAHDAFFARMRQERFDLALQLHGGGRYSNTFVNRLGARLTVGMTAPEAAPLDRCIPYVYRQHEVLRFLEVVRLIGAAPVGLAPRVAVTAADLAEAEDVLADDERPLVALNPGANDPERRWPPASFARVGDALTEAGARVVITGAGFDRLLADAIRADMRHPAVDTTGRLSLGGLAGLLSRCAVVVSNDTGPLHLAGAVGARTVGIFWCFNFINAAPVATERQRPLISWRVTCPVCGIDRVNGRCDHHPSFVADVPIAEVIATALELLGSARAVGAAGAVTGVAPR